jgi:hypothetical protein
MIYSTTNFNRNRPRVHWMLKDVHFEFLFQSQYHVVSYSLGSTSAVKTQLQDFYRSSIVHCIRLIDYILFTSISTSFHLWGVVTRMQILGLCSALRSLSREGTFYVIPAVTWGVRFDGLFRKTASFSRLLRLAKGAPRTNSNSMYVRL